MDERYNAVTHSFLRSCAEVLKDAPSTLLREHYRCHPKIIQFCNHRFYGGELIAMTKDSGEKDVLQVIRTVKGNHAREHFNQREIDVIVQEVMPLCEDKGSVGIITPYRTQAEAINRVLGKDVASTVHKYQGRECDTIIMDDLSASDTIPFNEIHNSQVALEHEAKVSKISEEQLYYLMSRGLSEQEATEMIVMGFVEPFTKELPMEYAVELNRLISYEMEGSVG